MRASNTHLFILSPTKGVFASDGTDAGTKLIVPQGAQPCLFENQRSFVTLNGIFYWVANAGGFGGLWRSDGTAEGTYRLVQWTPAGLESCDGGNLIVANGKLFFRGKDAAHGIELWTSDGTVAGTRIAADVAAGATSSNPTELTLLGDTLFFSASTPETGQELFAYYTLPTPKHRSVKK